MLTPSERSLVFDHAYVPEHLPDYVTSISEAEPFLHEAHICFVRKAHLIFIGYPFQKGARAASKAYESACKRFEPSTVAIIAPKLWMQVDRPGGPAEDHYYRLDLPLGTLTPDQSYMIRRATRELSALEGVFGGEHENLVTAFVKVHDLVPGHRDIFTRIKEYLSRSSTARVLEVRKGTALVAFSIVELGSAQYGFYMFNFRSTDAHVPGASDLLFYEMSRLAWHEGKRWLNLGLGMHSGVRRFKEKWGAKPFLAHVSTVIRRRSRGLLSTLVRL